MIYLDTNIFAYAIQRHEKYGEACRRILLSLQAGKIDAACSMLVLVELHNVLRKINKLREKEGKAALDVPTCIDAVLSYPLVWLDFDFVTVKKAALYGYKIGGADCVHLASMELAGISRIVSVDADFDKAEGFIRVDPLHFKP